MQLVEELNILPGVHETINDARTVGLRLAMASSSPRDWVVHHLHRLGIYDVFDCILTREDVTRVKPDPELFLSTVNYLSLTPAEAIVLEDSLNGVVAAKAAGIFCIAVPNPLTAQLDLDHADLILNSMADLDLHHLLVKLDHG